MSLGTLLAAKRKKTGDSLATVSACIGITKSYLHDLEKGRTNNPTLSTITRLMAYYGITWDEVIKHWRES